ncbi:MAG: histidine phosphatase family protein [Verrucomicrobia bacterium]|nr:histidine phosphatase family protein [Verrucomicrobiota bacterium]
MIIKKEFYFVRHGQTDYNASSAKVDHADVSLNTMGLKQAQDIEPIIASLSIKSVCYSPLKRAKETKEILSARLAATQYEIPELGECTSQIWRDMTTYGSDAYESPHTHVKAFMNQVVHGINQALSFEDPVLIVAHGGTHWATCCLMGITDHNWIIDNCLPVHFFIGHDSQWKAQTL